MPQWAGSCWYYLRFLDPDADDQPWAMDAYDAWMPVDLYVGGAEHAVLHLLYARFWHKVLFDLGHVRHPEPFLTSVDTSNPAIGGQGKTGHRSGRSRPSVL